MISQHVITTSFSNDPVTQSGRFSLVGEGGGDKLNLIKNLGVGLFPLLFYSLLLLDNNSFIS